MTERRRCRRPCLRCDVCLELLLLLALTRPGAVGCVPSKRSIICLLCAPLRAARFYVLPLFRAAPNALKYAPSAHAYASASGAAAAAAAASASSFVSPQQQQQHRAEVEGPRGPSAPSTPPVQWFIFCHNLCRFGCCC